MSIDWTMNALDARKILGEQRKPPKVEAPVVIDTDGKAPRVLQVTQKVELLIKSFKMPPKNNFLKVLFF